jgi:hypothetical protein
MNGSKIIIAELKDTNKTMMIHRLIVANLIFFSKSYPSVCGICASKIMLFAV